MGDLANAEPAAREAFALATGLRHAHQTLFALSYVAAVAGERNAGEAARLVGYAEEGLRRAGWTRVSYDRAVVDRLEHKLKQQLTETELSRLFAEGAALSEEEAIVRATALLSQSDVEG
jgi:hypothetical protein